MNNEDLKSFGFARWIGFSLLEESVVLENLPKHIGVYAIRDKTGFGRYRGTSDLVYFGSAINQNGLRQRIRLYFHPGPTQQTSQRIHRILEEITTLQIAWVLSSEKEEAKSLETQLLAKYCDDHMELTPFNRQG